jgi:hypothetical protein
MRLDLTLQNRLAKAGVLLWGLFLAIWLARVWFLCPPDRIHVNHEAFSYVGRLIEFRDQLRAGYLSPQWCTNFRGGLGSPHNLYYQPGLFYAASLVPWSVPPVRALGLTVGAFALLGYVTMYALVAERFGRAAGCLAASTLLLATYTCTNLYLRGDLSEYAAMMVLPAALYGLAGWLEHGRLRAAVVLTLAAASLIVLHPAVGLLAFGLLALALVGFAWETRRWDRLASALLLLALAIGLAAFYWVPVFFGMDLVKSEEAFVGDYYYSRNFLPSLRCLVMPYSHEWPGPLALGVLLPLMTLGSLSSLVWAWNRMTPAQRRLAVFCLGGALCFVFLMLPLSKPLWYVFRPMQRIQFPWRTLTVVTVLLAATSGVSLLWQPARRRAIIAGLLLLALWGLSSQYTAYSLDERHIPQNVGELARENFAPDICGEWLPQGAAEEVPQDYRNAPLPGPNCQVERFQRTQGRLTCHVRTSAASTVLLPHYYFSTGWRATLNGQAIALKAGPYGLMQLDLPGPIEGELAVTFSCTPLRAAGLLLSALSSVLGLGILVIARRRQELTTDGVCSSIK